ncbi:MAG: glycosyltransferase [Ferruginibacter sp.]
MKADKPEIVFIFQDLLGGVSSFNFNIINFSTLKSRFHVKVILVKESSDVRPVFQDYFEADEISRFSYSAKENQHHLQKRLNGFIGNTRGAIVTDYGLAIQAARRFNNPKTIFNLIHDFYYVKQQMKLGKLTDVALAHASFFSDAVFAADPTAFAGRSFYIPYGVQQRDSFPEKDSAALNLVFLGRLEEGKGAHRLVEIQKRLQETGISVNWTIIGRGSLSSTIREQWSSYKVAFFEPETTKQVYELLGKQDIFIFPTTFEGTPVSILECLANGVVSIVNDLPGGIRDIVTKGIGFRCKYNDMDEFVTRIQELHFNRPLLKEMQQNCFALAHASYDIRKNADLYFEMFLQFEAFRRTEGQTSEKLVKLDRPFIPNWLSKKVRQFR